MPEPQIPSSASRTLARLLEENAPLAKRLRARFGKGVLWRIATGRRRPELETAALLAHLTGGKVPERARAWIPSERWSALVKG